MSPDLRPIISTFLLALAKLAVEEAVKKIDRKIVLQDGSSANKSR